MPVTPLPLLEPPASLCVLRLSALGDVSHMVPVVRSIQAQWPDTRISWCLGKLEHELLGDLPDIDFFVLDKSRGWRAPLELRRRLGGRQNNGYQGDEGHDRRTFHVCYSQGRTRASAGRFLTGNRSACDPLRDRA